MGVLPDYPKVGVWPDAYYVGVTNLGKCGSPPTGPGAVALERAALLNGTQPQIVRFNRTDSGDQSQLLPADLDGPPPPSGAPNYFAQVDFDDAELDLYAFSVDWITPSNSSFTLIASLAVAPFDATVCANDDECIEQPGTTQKLDALANRLMYRLQYRNFGSYQTLVTNHTVDADAVVGASGRAGVRWYELRNSGSGWSLHQQGTYAPDPDHRWTGSIAMNGDGDLALGYTVASTSTHPSIRIAGQTAGAPAGLLNAAEQVLMAGSGSQTGTFRWGDYSMMAVDPVDDRTFWYTHEYYPQDGPNSWHTRIGAFDTAPATVTVDGLALTDTRYYEARDALTAGSALVVASGADVTLRVTEGGLVEFSPGFEAELGSALHAYVDVGSGAARASVPTVAIQLAGDERVAPTPTAGRSTDPAAFRLAQNYPNPFSLATEIAFDLPERSDVLLVVYDVMGREVDRLADESIEAGSHHVRFDASGISSGTYVVQFQPGDVVLHRKMTVLR